MLLVIHPSIFAGWFLFYLIDNYVSQWILKFFFHGSNEYLCKKTPSITHQYRPYATIVPETSTVRQMTYDSPITPSIVNWRIPPQMPLSYSCRFCHVVGMTISKRGQRVAQNSIAGPSHVSCWVTKSQSNRDIKICLELAKNPNIDIQCLSSGAGSCLE